MLYHKNNKKGITQNVLFFIITTLVAFFIILFVIISIWSKADDNVSEATCRASVIARVNSIINIGPAKAAIIPLRCKTQEKKALVGNKEAIMEQISYMSAKCWWMFLNGEYQNLFDRTDFLNNNKCFICYSFTVEPDITITSEELLEYMTSHYYIETEDVKVTYLDYIQSYKGNGAVLIGKGTDITGKKETPYSINLLSPDVSFFGNIWNNVVSSLSGDNSDKKMNRIYIEKLDDSSKKCIYLESI